MTDVDIPEGTLIDIPEGKWKYGNGRLRLRVQRVLNELSQFYGGTEVWIEGARYVEDRPPRHTQVLVRVDALPTVESDGRL